MVKGYRIEFEQKPVQLTMPGYISFNKEEKEIVQNEIDKFLKKGIIEKTYQEAQKLNFLDSFVRNIVHICLRVHPKWMLF